MTRVEALKELLEKVEAGEWFAGLAQLSFGGVQNYHSAASAYNGSLDAANALHDAVLPGWTLTFLGQTPYDWTAAVFCEKGALKINRRKQATTSDTPARAWLIAILKALIAQEKEKE